MQIKILDERITKEMLKPSTPGSAAIDLRSCMGGTLRLYPGDTEKIPVGIALHMKHTSMAAMILPRSGLGSMGLVLANTVGLIDSDYQGQIFVNVLNRNLRLGTALDIEPMQPIAQIIFVPVLHPEQQFVEEFDSETMRGSGGFGSTG